jgi:gluconolactonase
VSSERIRTQFEWFDDRFRGCDGDGWIERLFDGGRWTEGPAYFAAGRYLLFSDIPNDRIMRWDETTGAVGVFRAPSHFVNANLADRHGRLVTCEQGTRRVTRTEPNGSVTVLADQWQGHRFNSPDVVVEHSNGSLWFSDPSYGIDSDYEGIQDNRDLDRCMVFRLDPATAEVTVAVEDLTMPNGLAFTEDESALYVVDCGTNQIHRYSVVDAGARLGAGEVFATGDSGPLDSIALDNGGRLWAAAGAGVDCFHPDGTRLARLHLPETVANMTFGGPRGNDLFIAATSSIYQLRLKVTGAHYPAAHWPSTH